MSWVFVSQAWVRRRITQAGLPRPDSIHLISSTKQFGVKGLLSQLQKDAGVSGDVWVVSLCHDTFRLCQPCWGWFNPC